MSTAASSAEVDHVRRRVAAMSIVGEAPRERVCRIHFADSAIEHRYTAPLEHALPFELESHHDQPARKCLGHGSGMIYSAPSKLRTKPSGERCMAFWNRTKSLEAASSRATHSALKPTLSWVHL